jgi:hypothetical protein
LLRQFAELVFRSNSGSPLQVLAFQAVFVKISAGFRWSPRPFFKNQAFKTPGFPLRSGLRR